MHINLSKRSGHWIIGIQLHLTAYHISKSFVFLPVKLKTNFQQQDVITDAMLKYGHVIMYYSQWFVYFIT